MWVGNSVSKRKQTLQLTGPVFFPGDGFIVYDPNRKIISRFDSYGHDSEPKDELVILMDATGNGLLALHRKVSSFFQTFSWIDSKTFGGSSPGLTIIINIHVLTVTLRQ